MTKSIPLADKKITTAAHEDYLKAIYLLTAQGDEVSNTALTHYLAVSPASATNMVKKLANLELVLYTPYQNITLTARGEQVALEVLRHHRLIELYLHEKLKLPWEQVHAEAERLEHVISETVEDAIAAALDNPTIDPHGDPIPGKDGRMAKVVGIPLSRAELDQPYRLVRVLIQDAARLTYLGELHLYLNTLITVHKRTPFAGPLLIDVAGEHYALAHDMAELLLVAPEHG
jgi:DtxR family transcriptional regulator, Mn-dependent transcriptional regulator